MGKYCSYRGCRTGRDTDKAKCKIQEIKGQSNEKKDAITPSVKSSNPLDNLDIESEEFQAGVNNLAKLLKISRHSNHLVTLATCTKLVCERLNPSAIANPSSVIAKGKPYPIMDMDLGDQMLNNAAKALSLLYIQDLRNLQTRINEAIVSVQNVTTNPKTDTKLGQDGM